MQGTQQEPGEAQLSIGWHNGVPAPAGDYHRERAATYAAILTRTLAAQGYRPRRLDIVLRHGAHGQLEMRVHGDVPRIAEPDFVGLAQATLHAANLGQHLDSMRDVQVWATLGAPGVPEVPPA